MSSGKSKFDRFKVLYLSTLIAQITLEIIDKKSDEEEFDDDFELEFEEVPSDEEGEYWYGHEYQDALLGFNRYNKSPIRRDERLEEISDLLDIPYAKAWEYAQRVKSESQDEIILAELELARQLARFSK